MNHQLSLDVQETTNEKVLIVLDSSVYDNILSVKAPFIMDLFSIVEEVVEIYSQNASPSVQLDLSLQNKKN